MRSTDRRRRGASGPRPQPTVDDGNNDLRAGANQALYLENMQPPGARGVDALGRFCICVFGVAVAIAPTDALVAAGAKRPTAVFGAGTVARQYDRAGIRRQAGVG